MKREVAHALAAALAAGLAGGSVVAVAPDARWVRVEERLRDVEQAVLVLTCRLVPEECRR